MNMTIAEVLWATGGTSLHPRSLAPTAATQRIRHVALDSRQVQPGSLFVALPGERVDGHDFVEAAFAAGAAVASTHDGARRRREPRHDTRSSSGRRS